MDSALLVADYYNVTTVHPFALIALLIAGAAMMILPRTYAIVPILVLACFVSPAQRIIIATLDFNFLRMMILMGWIRVLVHGEWRGFRWRSMDTVVLAWAMVALLVPTLHNGTAAVLVNRLGYFYDAVGLYYLVRMLVRSRDDLVTIARAAAMLAIPVMGAFLVEKSTGRNIFAVFGGVPEYTSVRGGRLRCRGPFLHPILAGAFWCAMLPIIMSLWWHRGWNRPLAVIGTVASMIIIYSTASATSTNGMMLAMLAMLLFPIRAYLGWMRWAMIIGGVLLHLAMNGPLWSLIAKMNSVTGSTGWYRYKLIDDFVNHFFDWWLVGTTDFSDWWLGGRFALTSEYVIHGVRGGVLTLGLFVAIIVVGFINVGRALVQAERSRITLTPANAPTTTGKTPLFQTCWTPHSRMVTIWALGASLFTHTAIFFGVGYFAQAILMWYLSIGMISSLSPIRTHSAHATARLRILGPRRGTKCQINPA